MSLSDDRAVSELCANYMYEYREMIHTASLLHDDVIDMSDIRRGKASANSNFGNKLAVLAGDFLLARASVCLARLRSVEAMELLSVVIEQVRRHTLLLAKGLTMLPFLSKYESL
jgi:geranylgeranyl pyrophosphate synthase